MVIKTCLSDKAFEVSLNGADWSMEIGPVGKLSSKVKFSLVKKNVGKKKWSLVIKDSYEWNYHESFWFTRKLDKVCKDMYSLGKVDHWTHWTIVILLDSISIRFFMQVVVWAAVSEKAGMSAWLVFTVFPCRGQCRIKQSMYLSIWDQPWLMTTF